MSVLPFIARPRPHFELKLLGTLWNGDKFFVIDLFDDDGGCLQIWSGSTYADALDEVRDLREDGLPILDLVGGANA